MRTTVLSSGLVGGVLSFLTTCFTLSYTIKSEQLDAQQSVDIAECELSSCKNTVKATENELLLYKGMYAGQQREINDLNNRLNSLEAGNGSLQQERDSLSDQLVKKQAQVDSITRILNSTGGTNEDLQRRLAQKNAEIQSLRQQISEIEIEFQEQVADILSRSDSLNLNKTERINYLTEQIDFLLDQKVKADSVSALANLLMSARGKERYGDVNKVLDNRRISHYEEAWELFSEYGAMTGTDVSTDSMRIHDKIRRINTWWLREK